MISKSQARQKIFNIRKNLQLKVFNEMNKEIQNIIETNLLNIINKANIVASYINFNSEPNINLILKQYKDLIYLPVIQEKGEKMTFQSWDFNPLHLRKNPLFAKNILYEPFDEFIKTETPNLIFVPGVAFDTKGNRVGYGAGYYDKTLESMENIIKIGVGFDFQLLNEDIKVENHDIGMNYILTEKKFLFIKTPNINK